MKFNLKTIEEETKILKHIKYINIIKKILPITQLNKLQKIIKEYIHLKHDYILLENNVIESHNNINKIIEMYPELHSLNGIIKQFSEENKTDPINPYNNKKLYYYKYYSKSINNTIIFFSFENNTYFINELLHLTFIFNQYLLSFNADKSQYYGLNLFIFDINTPRNIKLGHKEDKYHFDSCSGLTTNKTIIVSKRDEIQRLIIHELIHYYKITHDYSFDTNEQIKFKNYAITPIKKLLKNNYINIKHNNYFEAGTETFAILLLYSYLSIINPKYTLIEYLSMELAYNIKTFYRILNLDNITDYLNTQYYSYIYIRIIHLLNTNIFLDLLFKNHTELYKYIPELNNELVEKLFDYWEDKEINDDISLRFSLFS